MSEPLKLFAFGTGWGIPFETAAPFPLKLATWLRMVEIPFELVVANDPRKGPKGKSPWIEWRGVRMGDTALIIEHLRPHAAVDLDGSLDARQRAMATAVQRMLEEHYHQCYEHQLFLGRGGPARLAEFTADLPVPLRWLVPRLLARSLREQLRARGMGRHAESVIVAQGQEDLDALAELLEANGGPFFFGTEPASLDASIFGFLGTTLYAEGDNPLFAHAAADPGLVRYCEHVRARYFPESLERLPPLDGGGDVEVPVVRPGVSGARA